MRVQLPAVQFVPREAGGKAWTQLMLLEQRRPGRRPGTPGIPVVSDILGRARRREDEAVKTNDVDKLMIDGVDVFPVQPDPVDQATEPRPNFLTPAASPTGPFQLNRRGLREGRPVPAKPADVGLARHRCATSTSAALQIPAAQYNPDSKKLRSSSRST